MKEDKVSHYLIRKQIGQGGMGVVCQAWDTRLERPVAIKSVAPEFAAEPEARLRILREAKAAASLDHPFICKIFDTVEADGRVHIVMEYVEGKTLASIKLGPQDAIRIGIEISEALEEAHSRGIVHRDLKPSNVMLTRSGHVKIMDFGLAKMLPGGKGDEVTQQAETATDLTAKEGIIGSTPYMSPEQLRAGPVDARSDVFSFGVMMYELIAGHRPFYGATPLETIAAILTDEPEPMSRHRRGVPEELEGVVRKMLAKDPDARYQSASKVRAALARLADRAAAPRKAALRKRLLATGAAGIIAVVILFWAFTGFRGIPSRQSVRQDAPQSASGPTPDLFDQARILSLRLSRSANEQAIRYLEEYIRRSPEQAQAYSALALEKLKRFWWYQEDPQLHTEAFERATQALSLDPGLAEARAILAIVKTLESGDPSGYVELARCLESDPTQPEALAWLSFLFLKGGEFSLAGELMERLDRRQPESPYVNPLQAFRLLQTGEFAALLKQIGRLKREFPDWDGASYAQALMGIRMANLQILQKAIDDLALVNPNDPSVSFWKAYLRAAQRPGFSSRDLEPLIPYIRNDHEFAALYAQICARSGSAEEALKWLEHSVEKGNYDLVQMNHPDFGILEGHPRFASLKNSLHKKVARLAAQIKPYLRSSKKAG